VRVINEGENRRHLISQKRDIDDKYKEIIDRFIDAFDEMLKAGERGVEVKWIKPWSPRGVLHSNIFTPYRAYSGCNQLLCDIYCLKHGWSSRYWITEAGIKKVGGKVRAGEEPVIILGFIPNLIRVKMEGEEGEKSEPEEIYDVSYYILEIPIYNVEQTLNVPLPRRRVIKKENKAERIIERMADKPRIVHEKIDEAFYNVVTDTIHLPLLENFKSRAFYYDTLFHELAHSTGHESRLNRNTLNEDDYFNVHLYAEEELIAELASAFLSDYCGISCERLTNNTMEYLKAWITRLKEWRKQKPEKLAIYSSMAMQASNYILGRKPPKRIDLFKQKHGKKVVELSLEQDIAI